MRSVKGFTLIELMVTIAVAAILLSIAVPSFTNMMRGNSAETQREAVMSALSLARLEAVKRGETVTLEPISAGNWSSGFRMAAGTEVIKIFPALESATLTSTAGTLQFDSRGYLSNPGAGGQSVVLRYRVASDMCRHERDISVNIAGRIAIQRRTC